MHKNNSGFNTHTAYCEESDQVTRLQRSKFNFSSQRVICEKPYSIRQKASTDMTNNRGLSLYNEAKTLNDDAMLIKIQ